MNRSRKKSEPRPPEGDMYEISGDVRGNAVIVQGPKARVDITQRQATPSEIQQQAQSADLELLGRAISKKLENLKKQVTPSFEKGHNPYRFGQPLSTREANLFCGRETITSAILEHIKKDSCLFLAGNGGSGKTSLIQAGLIPQMIKQGGLPIFVDASSDSLDLTIRRQFLGEVTQTQYLSQTPLSTFLGHVIECLPQTRHIYLLVDELEEFLLRDPSDKEDTTAGSKKDPREEFKQEWLYTLSVSPRIHWLFGIHLGFSHLLNFFRPEVNPFADLVVLSPLDRQEARQAILSPASLAGIEIQDAVCDDILDRLGGTSISPAHLETVCYILAGGSGQLRLKWTLADYEAEGRADGILNQSLEKLIDQLPRKDREAAWQVLAAIEENQDEITSVEWLSDHLKSYGIDSETTPRLLKSLEEIHLIDVEDERYFLANDNMQQRIREWIQEQRALIQARQEARYQLKQLRNSAFRGLIGGALGFILFDQLIYTGANLDLSYRVFFATQLLAIGGIVGFLLTLTIDVAIATYRGSNTWLRYLVGSVGGIIAFSLGIALYVNNYYVGDTLLEKLPAAMLEGALWGAVIGLGAAYALSNSRRSWMIVLGTAVASGLVLLGVESKAGVLGNPNWDVLPSSFAILVAGALMPFCYLAAALFRRPGLEKRW